MKWAFSWVSILVVHMCISISIVGAQPLRQIEKMKETTDLDGDGREETVYFASFNIFRGSDETDSHYTFVLQVNGDVAAFRGNNLNGNFAIVDIDTNDCFTEIAVPEEGQSDDYFVHYFRYSSGEIVKLGTLPGAVAGWNRNGIDGSGIIYAQVRGKILDTWFYRGEFKYDPVMRDFVESPRTEFVLNRKVVVKKKLPLFKEKNMTEVAFIAQPGEKGLITKTDNKLWCLFESESGKNGWFPVIAGDIFHIYEVGYEVFDGLQLAD
jgi:hypothetical protein